MTKRAQGSKSERNKPGRIKAIADARKKARVVRAAVQYKFPTADIDEMLAQIGKR